jgi:RHS repeat-associated protein
MQRLRNVPSALSRLFGGAVLISVVASLALQPPTPAEAAALWHPASLAKAKHRAAPPPTLDPAYVAPVARGVSYQSPLDAAIETAAFDPRAALRASGLGSLLPMLPPQPNSYVSTVNADNPIAYWQLGEASGTTMVDSRNFDSGTYQGGVTLGQPSLVQPASGTSITLNGTTGYGTAPALTALQGANTRSIELWFQSSSQTAQSLFDAGANAGNWNQMFSLIVVPQGWVTNNPPAGTTTPGLYLGLWRQNIYFPDLYLLDGKRHHVVVELSGNNIWMYVDGTTPGGYFTDSGGNDNYGGSWNYRYLMPQPITLLTALNTGINPVLVGNGRYVSTNTFNGRMQHVAVYSTALTAAQVQSHWQAGNGLPWGPIIGAATAGQNQVTLSWQAPTFNGTGITGYVVTPKVGTKLRTPITFSTAATTQIIPNLSGGTAYTFTVNAMNALGTGISSDPSAAATPTGPALAIYEDTVIADSPIGFWPLGETSGNTATDLTTTGNGIYRNSYAQGLPGPVVNIPSNATRFSGTGAYVRLNRSATLEPANLSLETWIKPASIPANNVTVVVSPQPGNSDSSSANGYTLWIEGNTGRAFFGISTGSIGTPTAVPVGAWTHVVGTSDGSTIRLYINGKQQSVGSAGPTNYGGAANFDALITRFSYPGDIADVALFSSPLSPAQVANHYAVAGYASGPVSNLVATASTNSAGLTWTAPSYTGTSPITSYIVTPIVDGTSSTPITVNGSGTGANIPNLPGGASYTFQVQAVNASGPGVIVTSSSATINSPAAGPGGFGTYLYLRSGPGQGQAYSKYGFVSRNNVPALSRWTLEARLWGFNSLSVTGGYTAWGLLSGTVTNPSPQNPIAGIHFNIGGAPLQSYFVWPGGSCPIPSDASGIPIAFNGATTTAAHVALTYDGATVSGYINGSQICGQATAAAAVPAAPFGLMDGSGMNQNYLDEFRVSNVARWTGLTFTPPTQQYATDANTNVLWHFNDYPISKLPSMRIIPGAPDGGIIPSTYRDSSGSLNHANTAWSTGAGVFDPTWEGDVRRPYSLGQGVTADELIGNGSPWLCSCTASSTASPVNNATGEFWHTFTDYHIPGRIPLDFSRTYSSLRAGTVGRTGYGWTDNYNQYVSFDVSGNATVRAGNGSGVRFAFTAPSTYTAPPSEHVTLVKNADGTFTLTDSGQNQTIFNIPNADNVSTLQRLIDRHGGAAYTLTVSDTPTSTTITDPAGRTLTLAYQTIGGKTFIANIMDSAAPIRSVLFQYGIDPLVSATYQNLVQVTDVANGLTRFTYDTSHRLLTMTDPNNGVTTNTYETSSPFRITSQKDPMNRITNFSYSGGITTVTDPKNNVTKEEYLNGILLSRTLGSGTPQAATWTYAYDGGALGTTAIVGPNGQAVTSVRDSNANVLSVTDGLGRRTSKTYNSFSQPLTVTDPLGVSTTYTYSPTGDLRTTSRPLVGTTQTATTTYTYGDLTYVGDVTQMTDPDTNAWTYTYDTYGMQASITDPLGNLTTYSFDTIGRMTSMVTPKGNVAGGLPTDYTWTYGYDAFGNRTSVTDPLNHQTLFRYDANQNLDRVTDPNLNVTTNVYNLNNELIQVKRADTPQTILVTDYNADGTLLAQKDGKGNAIQTYAYDSLAHVTSTTDALNNVTTYVFDPFGNLLSKQSPSGNCGATPATGCTKFNYDGGNQLTSVTYSDGVTPNVYGISYDADGQRTRLTDGTGSSSWSWDSLNRMVSYVNGAGAEVRWAYNLRNLNTAITYPGSLSVSRGYDTVGRWTSVQDWNTNLTQFGYDENSNLITETFPAASGIVDTFTFDRADKLSGVTSAQGSTTLFTATYGRDNANQLTSDSSAPLASSNYKYTPLNQLCYAGSASSTGCSMPPGGSIPYKYDAADNLVQMGSTQQSFNNADQLCWTAPTTGSCATPPSSATRYQYDTRGNRTSVTPATGPVQTLAYDQANRLTRYVGSSTTTYGYNADGLRMSKTTGVTTQFVWNVAAGRPLLLKDGSSHYVYGPGGLPLEQISGASTYYFHHDQLGSTRLLTDSLGATQATYSYDPYGNIVATSGSVTNPLCFGGQYRDSESGYYYLGARYYDSSTGQFITTDPALRTTRSPYAYASGSPLNLTDLTGLGTVALCASFGVTVPGFHFGVNGCAVIDNHLNYGYTITSESGFGVGFSASATGQLQLSNANTIYDLAGPFTASGACFGPVVTACAEGARGTDVCGRDVGVGSIGLGIGTPIPPFFEAHSGGSDTTVIAKGGPGTIPCLGGEPSGNVVAMAAHRNTNWNCFPVAAGSRGWS